MESVCCFLRNESWLPTLCAVLPLDTQPPAHSLLKTLGVGIQGQLPTVSRGWGRGRPPCQGRYQVQTQGFCRWGLAKACSWSQTRILCETWVEHDVEEAPGLGQFWGRGKQWTAVLELSTLSLSTLKILVNLLSPSIE